MIGFGLGALSSYAIHPDNITLYSAAVQHRPAEDGASGISTCLSENLDVSYSSRNP